MKDVGRKVPFLWSDVRDGFSLQCLASVLFLYCACMSPVITFGGLLGEATRGNIVSPEGGAAVRRPLEVNLSPSMSARAPSSRCSGRR